MTYNCPNLACNAVDITITGTQHFTCPVCRISSIIDSWCDNPFMPNATLDPQGKTVGAKDGFYEDGSEVKTKDVVKKQVDAIKAITDERGKNYGKPIDHFACCQNMYDIWDDRFINSMMEKPDDITDKEQALCHGVHWILDKLVRAAENPMHKDNWDDIEGYARCIKDALGLEEK